MIDPQQQRVLERLRRARGEPLPFAALRLSGIDFPAAVISELELAGMAIERVYRSGRLLGVRLSECGAHTALDRRRRWSLWLRR